MHSNWIKYEDGRLKALCGDSCVLHIAPQSNTKSPLCRNSAYEESKQFHEI
jgi:hypothetical protein